jgi:hypothetical protein
MNHYTVFNIYQSSLRNSLTMSTIGISLILFNNYFKKNINKILVKLLGIILLILSLFISYSSYSEFLFYLENNKDPFPQYIPIDSWKNWIYVNYIHMLSIFSLIIIMIVFSNSDFIS